MTAEETLEIVSKQWRNLEDLIKISQVGRNSALKIKRTINILTYSKINFMML